MTPASLVQKIIIDASRHAECCHPRACQLEPFEFLSCKRCGLEFVAGELHYRPVQLRRQDPPGESHLSSYRGTELGNDVEASEEVTVCEGPRRASA